MLAPWTVGAVGFSLAFPLLYVLRAKPRAVPGRARRASLVHVPLSLVLRELWGLEGLALALGRDDARRARGAALRALASGARRRRGLARARRGVGRGVAALSFGVFALVSSDALAAAGGLAAYAVLLALLRPRGLREAWGYVRELH